MVKINLLAYEPGQDKEAVASSSAINLKPASLALLGVSAVFLLLGGYLRVLIFFTQQRFETLRTQKAESMEINKKVEGLKKEYQGIEADYNFYSRYIEREVVWSRKLGQLRRLLPEEIWFTRLFLQKQEGKEQAQAHSLLIKGGLIPRRNLSFIGTLSEFINHMKEDQEFFSSFDSPTLTDVRTETWQNTAIMTFSLEIPFKKTAAQKEKELVSPKK